MLDGRQDAEGVPTFGGDMSVTAAGEPTQTPLRGAGPDQTADNRMEQVLVHHLLDGAIDSLTDRQGGTHPFPWTPDQQVRIGVLGATYVPVQAATGAAPGPVPSAQAAGSAPGPAVAPPVDNRGVIGLDFVVDGGILGVPLTVDVEFVVYHPLIPDFASITAEAQSRPAATGRRRPTVPVTPAWVRDNRHVTFTMAAHVSSDERETTSASLLGGDPLEADAQAAVSAHYAGPDALRKLTNNQTLPVADALGTEAAFRQALDGRRDPAWTPAWPQPHLTVTTMPTVDGKIGVSVSITNARTFSDRSVQDLSTYDTRLAVTVEEPAHLEPQRLGFADDDLRYAELATVVGRGRGCVAHPGLGPQSISAETLPIYVQRYVKTSTHGLDISFENLAAGHAATLDGIAAAMRSFLRGWVLDPAAGAEEHRQQTDLRSAFEGEIQRFELGCDLLRRDPDLDRAFTLANRTFQAAKDPGAGWRLFQLVFIVTELGALAGRENPSDPHLREELDSVDVLWFPTGGGKTEAYLGLIAVALFYDRFRGKERGTTAWLLFPLRMLSVQQLARIAEITHHAESVRGANGIGGDPFALGYLVGAKNTPNSLEYNSSSSWWPGIATFAQWSQAERDLRRLIGSCPQCGKHNTVGLDADLPSQRLIHVCRECHYTLPIYCSDEEVTRYQPAVVVSTIDKIAAFSWSGQLTSFNRGPRKQCPEHGWYTLGGCVVNSCTTDVTSHANPVGFYDPTPALWIQDELHLVREDLGVFAGHYHTLVAELAVGAGHEPSKVIAATATIEQYQDQLSQVYGRRPRRFPAGGPTLARSFYTEETDDVRRLYLGVLPAGGGTAKVDLAATITTELIESIHDLTDDPAPLLATLASAGITVSTDQVRSLLFKYELVLAYVNSKSDGVNVQNDINRLSERLLDANSDRVTCEYLMGETSLGELAAAVAAIQDNTMSTPRAERIRALVGTSVISHGVDLDRLNFEVVAGMPSSYAQYIQATARAGRRHVGLVVSVFDRSNRRETSMFQSFATTHGALERMVEPVPVNRFASRAVERTLPGIVCALLWDETRDPRWATTDPIFRTRNFRPWWNANAASLIPELEERIARAYSCPVPDPARAADEQKLVADALDRWERIERPT